VPAPEELAYLLGWFAELNVARGSNGFGLMPIPYAEIDAWARLTGVAPLPFEVWILRQLDLVFLAGMIDGRSAGNPHHRH
jgi:hypothetical protein